MLGWARHNILNAHEMCENPCFLFPLLFLITLTCVRWTTSAQPVSGLHVFSSSCFLEVSVCVWGFSWIPQCQASVIQLKHFARFEVNCLEKGSWKVLEKSLDFLHGKVYEPWKHLYLESNNPKQPLAIIILWFDMVTYPIGSVENTEFSLQTGGKMQIAECRIFNWIFVFNLPFPVLRAKCNRADQSINQAHLSDVQSH